MLQLTHMWNGISLRHQIVIAVATLGMFAGVLLAARSSLAPDMALLYSGLESSAAGEVISALEQQGAIYEVRGGTIFVEKSSRDRFRMILASEGLPANGSAGYELLDNLSGFGTTAQMFDAAYWRAKEGELARTISASPNIKAARVHIARSAPRPFQQGSDNAASVSVTPQGENLSSGQARALRFLVSSAVAGLSPDAVTIIDGRTGMLIEGADINGGTGSEKAQDLRRNVTRLLEAHVGIGNAIVEVNVEHVSEHETIFERRLDPDQRVVISTDSTEKTRSSEGNVGNGGSVSVASNLPDGDAVNSGNGGGSSSSENESREQVDFKVSETTREISRAPGSVKRITVAVLVNGIEGTDENGEALTSERSAEELEALEQLVASAVGFDESRGDTVTIKSMNLDRSARIPDFSDAPQTSVFAQLDLMQLLQLAVLATVTLILGLFVIRPIFKAAAPAEMLPAPDGASSAGLVASHRHGTAGQANLVSGTIEGSTDPAVLSQLTLQEANAAPEQIAPGQQRRSSEKTAEEDEFEFPEMAAVDTAFVDPNMLISDPENDDRADPETHDAVLRLRNLIVSRRTEALEVLRGWMDQEDADEAEGVSS